jgi:hypothetical protein
MILVKKKIVYPVVFVQRLDLVDSAQIVFVLLFGSVNLREIQVVSNLIIKHIISSFDHHQIKISFSLGNGSEFVYKTTIFNFLFSPA